MRFLVDAQLPRRLARWLTDKGYETVHTLDLPEKNRTSDAAINELSIREQFIVISKDSDFFDRYFSHLEPYKLMFLTTGNISTNDLINVFELNLESIISEISNNNVVEISRTNIITIDWLLSIRYVFNHSPAVRGLRPYALAGLYGTLSESRIIRI